MRPSSPVQSARVGDLLEMVRLPASVLLGSEYTEIGIRSHGRGIFHKPPVTGTQIGGKRVFHVLPGCLALNIVFAWEGALAVTAEEDAGCLASHRFPMYRPRDNRLSVEYALLYFLSDRGLHELGIASPGGAGRNRTLGQKAFLDLEIPLATRADQDRIVDACRVWGQAISCLDQLASAKRKLSRDLASKLLTGESRFREFGKASNGICCPVGWNEVALREIAEVRVSGVDKKSSDSEIPVLLCNYSDVYHNHSIRSDMAFMSATATPHEVGRYRLQKNDVVVTKDSESPTDIGKAAAVVEDLPGVLCGYHLAILRPKRSVSGRFLAHALGVHSVREHFYRSANGVTRFGLSTESLESAKVRVPSLKEQERIAAVLDLAEAETDHLCREAKLLAQERSTLVAGFVSATLGVTPQEERCQTDR